MNNPDLQAKVKDLEKERDRLLEQVAALEDPHRVSKFAKKWGISRQSAWRILKGRGFIPDDAARILVNDVKKYRKAQGMESYDPARFKRA